MKNARWIWQNTCPQADEYVRFYDEFEAAGGEVTIDISSDSNYALYLNGKLESFGQYADYPHYKVYDSVRLHAVPGKNTLEIVVWYYGADSSTYTLGKAGLLYEIRQGETVLAWSGTHVHCGLTRDYVCGLKKLITGQLGFSFRYDTLYGGGTAGARACCGDGRHHVRVASAPH